MRWIIQPVSSGRFAYQISITWLNAM